MTCPHKQTAFYRHPMNDGRYHIAEHCVECGANVRGAGKWVPAREVAAPWTLPVFEGKRDNSLKLFENW